MRLPSSLSDPPVWTFGDGDGDRLSDQKYFSSLEEVNLGVCLCISGLQWVPAAQLFDTLNGNFKNDISGTAFLIICCKLLFCSLDHVQSYLENQSPLHMNKSEAVFLVVFYRVLPLCGHPELGASPSCFLVAPQPPGEGRWHIAAGGDLACWNLIHCLILLYKTRDASPWCPRTTSTHHTTKKITMDKGPFLHIFNLSHAGCHLGAITTEVEIPVEQTSNFLSCGFDRADQ